VVRRPEVAVVRRPEVAVVRRPEVAVVRRPEVAVAGLRSVPEALRRRPADRGTGIHMAVAGTADKVHMPEMGDKAGTVDMVVKTYLPPNILPIHWDNATSRQPARTATNSSGSIMLFPVQTSSQ
jgi:hypothetical protein